MFKKNTAQNDIPLSYTSSSNVARVASMYKEYTNTMTMAKNQEVVLFLGAAGAGKSTTINQLFGQHYEAYECPRTGVCHLIPASDNSKETVTVHHIKHREASFPNLYHDHSQNLVYAECSDFESDDISMSNACCDLGIQLIVSQAKSIKALVLVIDLPSIEVNRSNVFMDIAKLIGHVIQNSDTFFDQGINSGSNSVFFVFTKVPPHMNQDHLIAKFENIIKEMDLSEQLRLVEQEQLTLQDFINNSSEGINSREEYAKKLDINNKRANDIRAKIRILLLLQASKDRIFLHDTSGAANIEQLQTILKNTTNIPGQLIKPLMTEHLTFERTLQKHIGMVKQHNTISNDIVLLQQELHDSNTRLSELSRQKDIVDITYSSNTINETSQISSTELANLNSQYQTLQRKVEAVIMEQQELVSSLKLIDTNIPELYKSQRVVVREQKWLYNFKSPLVDDNNEFLKGMATFYNINPTIFRLFGQYMSNKLYDMLRDSASIQYNDIPFVCIQKSFATDIPFICTENSSPSHGMYSLKYTPEFGESGWVEVQIYAEKRQIHNKEIRILQEKISLKKKIIDSLNQEIDLVNHGIERLRHLLNGSITQQTRLLESYNRDRTLVLQQQVSLHNAIVLQQEELRLIKNYLINNQATVDFARTVSSTLSMKEDSMTSRLLSAIDAIPITLNTDKSLITEQASAASDSKNLVATTTKSSNSNFDIQEEEKSYEPAVAQSSTSNVQPKQSYIEPTSSLKPSMLSSVETKDLTKNSRDILQPIVKVGPPQLLFNARMLSEVKLKKSLQANKSDTVAENASESDLSKSITLAMKKRRSVVEDTDQNDSNWDQKEGGYKNSLQL